jgi:chromosome partitioning protein
MMIVLANSKGGVGKSTLAVHIAVWLYDGGHRVALLDADKQRSSSQWMAEAEPGVTIRTADSPDDCLSAAQNLHDKHEFVVGDGPAGMDDISRTLLLVADLALFPISPSILDLRSVAQATAILRYAQGINRGRPEGRLILNRIRTRETISRELRAAAPGLGLKVTEQSVRDLQAFRDAAQQGTVVTRMNRKGEAAAGDIQSLCDELFRMSARTARQGGAAKSGREVVNG